MSDRVRISPALLRGAFLLSALVALPLAGVTRLAGGDMIQTIDGKWQPLPADPNDERRTLPPPVGDDDPSNEYLVASEEHHVDATYETVKSTKGFNKPAAQVKRILASARVRNPNFEKGLNDASQKLWPEAAENFRAAAAELSGWGKQEALWLMVQALAPAGDMDRVIGGIDELLAAFPKSFFFAEAQILRAKIATSKKDVAGAVKALDSIKAAPGMNVRDLYRGEYTRVNLTLELQKEFDKAASEYQILVGRIEKEKDAPVLATTRQQCLLGLGNCLLALKKPVDAKGHFDRAAESRDADVLAGAYSGLGDVAFVEAKSLRDGGKVAEAKKSLEDAILHYLRVTELYRSDVSDESPVLRAMDNAAKVFTVLFEMSNPKECELADRACKQYYALFHMLPDSHPLKRQVQREYNDIAKKRDECRAKPGAAPAAAPAGKAAPAAMADQPPPKDE